MTLCYYSNIIKVYRFRYICILWRLKNDSPEKEDDKKKKEPKKESKENDFIEEILKNIKAQEMKKIKKFNKDKCYNTKINEEIKSNLETKNPKLTIIKKNVPDDKSFDLMKKEIDKLLEDIRTDFIGNLIKELF